MSASSSRLRLPATRVPSFAALSRRHDGNKWLQDGHWCYQKWSPALGSLVVDEGRPPLPHMKLVEALQLLLPIIMQPYMIHRFHATRPLADTMTGITAFQLDISNRTKGHLQVIGLQLRRDTLKQSPAAALVQQALAEYY